MQNQTINVTCERCEGLFGLEYQPLQGFGYWTTDAWFRCPSCATVNRGLLLPGEPVQLTAATRR